MSFRIEARELLASCYNFRKFEERPVKNVFGWLPGIQLLFNIGVEGETNF